MHMKKYLKSRDIKKLIIAVLRVESLNASALISKVKLESMKLYEARYNQHTMASRRIIYKNLKILLKDGVVRQSREGRSVVYRFKENVMFERELRDIVQRLRKLVDDKVVESYSMEEQKRFVDIGVKARRERDRVTSPIIVERIRLKDIAVKKYWRDILDATYGRNLVEELVELSNKLKNKFLFPTP